MTLPERDLGYLEDIRSYAAQALSFTAGMSFEEFNESAVTRSAVLRCLTVIGEAAGRLSAAARDHFPRFAWSSMKGMRSVLVHEYGRIDYLKVWDVIQNELPPLREELQRYLDEQP